MAHVYAELEDAQGSELSLEHNLARSQHRFVVLLVHQAQEVRRGLVVLKLAVFPLVVLRETVTNLFDQAVVFDDDFCEAVEIPLQEHLVHIIRVFVGGESEALLNLF